MAGLPNIPNIPGAGRLQRRAAELKAEMEAKQAQAEAKPQPGQEYTLQEGDTLESIARQVEQDPDAIWNHDNNKELRERRGSPQELEPGDTLFIPKEEKGTGPVGKGDYVVKQGDCMASIAIETGHFWETIWNDPENKELKETRKDPYILLPGDRVTIPQLRTKQESGATEERHRFVRRGCPEKLQIRFVFDDEPRRDEAYVLEIDGVLSEGKTDSDGLVALSIPPNAKKGKITFPDSGEEYPLDLGELDPITEICGVQKRLANLGFFHRPADGQMSKELAQAIEAFQVSKGLEPTGTLDEEARTAIQGAYGS